MIGQRRHTEYDTRSLHKLLMTPNSNLPISAKEIRDLLCNNNQKILNQLLCSICHQVILDAVECTACQRSFCKECIQNWLSHKSPFNKLQCPMKCDNGQFNQPHITIRQLIDGLEMKCPYQKNGCDIIITFQGLKRHIDSCQYKQQSCPNHRSGCKVSMLRNKINEHIPLCEYSQWICERCHQKTVTKMKLSHDCIKYLIEKISEQDGKIEELKQQNKSLISYCSKIQNLENTLKSLQGCQLTPRNSFYQSTPNLMKKT